MINNNLYAMMQQFIDFKNNFKGNPQEEVMKMLQSGRISQQDLNRVQQMATQFQQMLKSFK